VIISLCYCDGGFDRGHLSGFSLGSRHFGVVDVSHFLFAVDILVFSWAKPNYLYFLGALFLCFEALWIEDKCDQVGIGFSG
jgi:hypothetical protein